MNKIYEIEEGRPFWKLRPIMLLLTLVAVVLAAIALLLLIVSGPLAESIGNTIGLGDTALTVWSIVKWPILARDRRRWSSRCSTTRRPTCSSRSSAGSPSAPAWRSWSGCWPRSASRFYVGNFSSYNKTYGSLAGVIVTLLFLWITNLALLFGGELDAELERGRQLQAGIAAEEELQLPGSRHPQHQEGPQEAGQGHRARSPDPPPGEGVRRGQPTSRRTRRRRSHDHQETAPAHRRWHRLRARRQGRP